MGFSRQEYWSGLPLPYGTTKGNATGTWLKRVGRVQKEAGETSLQLRSCRAWRIFWIFILRALGNHSVERVTWQVSHFKMITLVALWRLHSLEKEMATHSCILAWRISWTEEPGRPQVMGHKQGDMTERLTHTQVWSPGWSLLQASGERWQ